MSALRNDADRARDLYQSLRYQLAPVGATTMGHCSNDGCEQWARGGLECAHCVAIKLADYIGQRAMELRLALITSRNAIEDAEEAIAEMETDQ